MHTHLKFVFKRAFHYSTFAIKLFKSKFQAIGADATVTAMNQSPFKWFTTRMTHSLLKLRFKSGCVLPLLGRV